MTPNALQRRAAASAAKNALTSQKKAVAEAAARLAAQQPVKEDIPIDPVLLAEDAENARLEFLRSLLSSQPEATPHVERGGPPVSQPHSSIPIHQPLQSWPHIPAVPSPYQPGYPAHVGSSVSPRPQLSITIPQYQPPQKYFDIPTVPSLHQQNRPYYAQNLLQSSRYRATEPSVPTPEGMLASGPEPELPPAISSQTSSLTLPTSAGVDDGYTFKNDDHVPFPPPLKQFDPATTPQRCPFPGCDIMMTKGPEARGHAKVHLTCSVKSKKNTRCLVSGCGAYLQACNYPKHFEKHLGGTPCRNGCGGFLARETHYERSRHEKACENRLAMLRAGGALQDSTIRNQQTRAILYPTQVIPGTVSGLHRFQLHQPDPALVSPPGVPTQNLGFDVSPREPDQPSAELSGRLTASSSNSRQVLTIRIPPLGSLKQPAASSVKRPVLTGVRRSSRLQDKPFTAAPEPTTQPAGLTGHGEDRKAVVCAQESSAERPRKKSRRS